MTAFQSRRVLSRVLHGAAVRVFGDATGARPEPLGYHNDVNKYWVDVLGCRPWKGKNGVPGQYELNEMLLENPFLLLFAGTGPGKTFWAARAASWHIDNFEDSIFLQMSSTWPQVRKQFWGEFRSARANALRKLPGKLNLTEITISDRWFGMGMSPAQPETLAGYHAVTPISDEVKRARDRWLEMTNEEYFAQPKDGEAKKARGSVRAFLDEASAIPDEFWDAAEGLMTGPNCGIVATGNLTRTSGRYFELWRANPPTTSNAVRFSWEQAA